MARSSPSWTLSFPPLLRRSCSGELKPTICVQPPQHVPCAELHTISRLDGGCAPLLEAALAAKGGSSLHLLRAACCMSGLPLEQLLTIGAAILPL